MALTNTNGDRIKHRRHTVARLRLRGGTMAEIEEALPKAGIINPDTGAPYSHGTIANDIKMLREEWRASAAADMAEHKARQLAELREARRAVWREGDLSEVRRNIETEMKLLGTAAPQRVEQETKGETILRVIYDDGIGSPIAQATPEAGDIHLGPEPPQGD